MTPAPNIIVEFFGLARVRSSQAQIMVAAATAAEALKQVSQTCPALSALLQADGRLAAEYLLCVNGTRFLIDLNDPLHDGDRLLLLSADAGG
ncbi:MAG TPA: MoaD/ThiS family protein [Gemmataceae bacterium]|jgi:molybdopterin converting factor small subunit|nr:MoaD/ThiS family protein [Gemmataceae bacterium]